MLEHFDAAYGVLDTMHTDGGWSSPYLITPYRAFNSELEATKTHTLSRVVIPAHSNGCTYPALHRLRLLPGRPAAAWSPPRRPVRPAPAA